MYAYAAGMSRITSKFRCAACLLALLSVGCGDDTERTDDDGGATVPDKPPGSLHNGNNVPPSFITFGTNVTELTEGETVRFTAVLTDGDGIGDLVGGALFSDDGTIHYGSFQSSAEEGAYHLDLSWKELDTVSTISLATGATSSRDFRAQFFDQGKNVVEETAKLELHCNDVGACDGICNHSSSEPNDGESKAYDLGKENDCDDSEWPPGKWDGEVTEVTFAGDTDWYTFTADDTLCPGEGKLKLNVSTAGVEICMFVDADGVDCGGDSSPAQSPGDRPGCCTSGGSLEMDPDWGWFFQSNDAQVYFRVTSHSNQCVSYTAQYDYL